MDRKDGEDEPEPQPISSLVELCAKTICTKYSPNQIAQQIFQQAPTELRDSLYKYVEKELSVIPVY
jgi:hypothetical protein